MMLETVQNTYFLSLIKILKVAGEKQPDSRRKRSQMTSLEKVPFSSIEQWFESR